MKTNKNSLDHLYKKINDKENLKALKIKQEIKEQVFYNDNLIIW